MKKYVSALLVVPMVLVSVGAGAQTKTELRIDLQDSPPKYMLAADGKASGLCIEIMRLLEAKGDFRFVYDASYTPSKRIESKLRSGEADIHFGWAKNPEREAFLNYGNDLYVNRFVGAVRINDKVDFNTATDLINLGERGQVLAVFGIASTGHLQKIPGLKVDDGGKTLAANLEKLAGGRGRVFVYHQLGISYELQLPQNKDRFKMVKIDWENNTSLHDTPQYVVFSKKLPADIVAKVNAALTRYKPEIDALVRKYGGAHS